MSILRGGEPILLLLEDGEIAGAGGAENVHLAGGGQIVLARPPGAGGDDDDEATLTLADGTDVLSLGGQFLTAEDLTGATKDAEGNLVTKIEVESVPVSILWSQSRVEYIHVTLLVPFFSWRLWLRRPPCWRAFPRARRTPPSSPRTWGHPSLPQTGRFACGPLGRGPHAGRRSPSSTASRGTSRRRTKVYFNSDCAILSSLVRASFCTLGVTIVQ